MIFFTYFQDTFQFCPRFCLYFDLQSTPMELFTAQRPVANEFLTQDVSFSISKMALISNSILECRHKSEKNYRFEKHYAYFMNMTTCVLIEYLQNLFLFLLDTIVYQSS